MTLEELKKLFAEQPTVFTEVLKHIVTTEEGKTLLDNHAKQYAEKVIGEKTSEIYNGIDKDILEILGVNKPADKKTYDFVKELVTELKTLKEKKAGGEGTTEDAKKVVELQAQLDEIKKANWEGKYNGLVTETAKKIEGFTAKITELETGNLSSLVNIDLATGLSSIKFNPNIPKEAIDAMTGVVKDKILKTSKVVDGKVVYYKEDGTPYLNELFKPITAEEIFKTELKSVVVGNVAGGGANPNEEKGKIITVGEGDTATKKVTLDPTKFNTKLTFATHIEEVLTSNGVEKNSEEWHKLTQEARKDYEVDKMERI